MLRRATAQGTEGMGRKYFVNFAKDGALKMLAMKLLFRIWWPADVQMPGA